jgi:polyisoprenoid-binding protein YceI
MTTTSETAILPLRPGNWALDTNHSTVTFAIRHLGVSKVRGRFNTFQADVAIGSTLADTTLNATVDLASIDTANAERDAHVRSADILDVATRPTLSFRSTGIVERGDGGNNWTLDGELTIGGITRPITLAVELGGLQEFPGGPRHAGFEATGELRRTEFGIGPGLPTAMLGDVVKIELDLQLLEPTQP